MQKTKLCALLLFSVMIVGLFALSPTFSSLMNSIIISSTGSISTSSIIAKSGSPMDIQTAVNAVVATGGGTVYIPAGTFTFNPPTNGTGVTIPNAGGISIIGAGIGITILQETQNPGAGYSYMFSHSGQLNISPQQGKPVRISGISFVGFVVDEANTNNAAISISTAIDFRIDHCSFQDFSRVAIITSDNTGNTWALINRGAIDHISIDNPYRDRFLPHNASAPQPWALWGYGIIVIGDAVTWNTSIAGYLGSYYPTMNVPTWGGAHNATQPQPMPIYIENSNFTRCRHAIAGNGGADYVSRYNYFQEALYGQNDAHGNGGQNATGAQTGTRFVESYGNVFNLTDESYSEGQDAALEIRGGGGVCWNNTVILNPSYNAATVQFLTDGESAPYDVEQFYLWNNTAVYSNGATANFNSKITVAAGVTQNANYFLRAPNQTLDGFSYTPFTYPLPLTLSA